jgi:hypothetical protein
MDLVRATNGNRRELREQRKGWVVSALRRLKFCDTSANGSKQSILTF